MKKIFLILVCLFIQVIVFSQNEKMNCIISVDGKIPLWILNLHIIVEDSTTIKLNYEVGDFIVDSADYQLLLNSKDKKATIYFELYVQGKDNKEYKGNIDVKTLFDSYCLLEITNLKKNKYSFGYSSSSISTVLTKRDKTVLLEP